MLIKRNFLKLVNFYYSLHLSAENGYLEACKLYILIVNAVMFISVDINLHKSNKNLLSLLSALMLKGVIYLFIFYKTFEVTTICFFCFLTEEIQYHDGLRSREVDQAPILLRAPHS